MPLEIIGFSGVVADVDADRNLMVRVSEPEEDIAGLTFQGTYMESSWRIVGTTATQHALATVYNNSARVCRIRRLAVDVSVSGATAYLGSAYFRYFHNTGVTPSGGTAPTQKTPIDSNMASSAGGVAVAFAASADGTASAITHAFPTRTPDREQALPNLVTAVGEWAPADFEIVKFEQVPLVLRGGEVGLLMVAGASVSHYHYGIKLWHDEWS